MGTLVRKSVFVVTALLVMSGCVLGHSPSMLSISSSKSSFVSKFPQRVEKGDGVVLNIRAKVFDGKYKTQAIVKPYRRSDISHVVLSLYVLDGMDYRIVKDTQGSPVEADIYLKDIDMPIRFVNLRIGENYRVLARAYKEPGVSFDSVISMDSQSFTDILTLRDSPQELSANLKIRLMDTEFGASVTAGGLDIFNGGVEQRGSVKISYAKLLVSLIAGGASGNFNGVGGSAKFASPQGLVVDGQRNVFLADTDNHSIRKIDPSGFVTTIAGNGEPGYKDGIGAAAQFESPQGIALGEDGFLYVTDISSVRKVSKLGQVITLAGGAQVGYVDGPGAAARFCSPNGIAIDGLGNVFVADSMNYCIRRIEQSGEVITYAGTGEYGYRDGGLKDAMFGQVEGIVLGDENTLYVADADNECIRKIEVEGGVTTFAGDGQTGYRDGLKDVARFASPFGLSIDLNGNLLVTDSENHCIRRIGRDGRVVTLAGTGQAGYKDGLSQVAEFYYPLGVFGSSSGDVYVADSYNDRVRVLR